MIDHADPAYAPRGAWRAPRRRPSRAARTGKRDDDAPPARSPQLRPDR
jgi:hypothetical protein